MAPTTTPAATIPLVYALAGNGTWLAYVWRQRPCCFSPYASPAMPAIRRRPVRSSLCITDSATVAQRSHRVESLASVCGYGIQCHRWFLSLRQLTAAFSDGRLNTSDNSS